MSKPFSMDQCVHHLRLTLLGHQVLLATDSQRITDTLRETFSSRFFAPACDGPQQTFFCSIHCDAPWDMAMELPPITFVGRASKERPYTFDLFRWSEEGVLPAGSFSYENSNDLRSIPTHLEIFAAYFQRRVLNRILHRKPSYRLVHAGSLAHEGSGMLLMAPSKAGKSTLVLAGILKGMQFLSDDHTPVDFDQGLLYPFPRALRLRQGSWDLIPDLSLLCSGVEGDPTGETRYYFHPERLREDALASATPLTHIVRMKGFSKQPKIAPANPADMAIGCATADFFPERTIMMDLVWRWAHLIDGVRCADLEVGHPLETAELLKAFLEEK